MNNPSRDFWITVFTWIISEVLVFTAASHGVVDPRDVSNNTGTQALIGKTLKSKSLFQPYVPRIDDL